MVGAGLLAIRRLERIPPSALSAASMNSQPFMSAVSVPTCPSP
jgi:hypothetical protein